MGLVLNLSEPALDMVLYGNKSHILSNYISQQLSKIPTAFNEFSQRIQDSLYSSYNYLNDKLTQYAIMNQVTSNNVNILDNQYVSLSSFMELQNANTTMQRWVMSHPDLRQLYIDQNVDGYSETYKNVFGKDTGEEDYNYRRVMNNVLTSTDEEWVVKHYIDELLPGDRELNHFEQVKVLHTYDTIDWILSNCKFDFTCKSEEPQKINRSQS